MHEVLVDLQAEFERIEAILGGLSAADWAAPSGATGWTIRDVVVHLAVSESGVATTLQQPSTEWHVRDHALDSAMDAQVRADTASAAEVFERWKGVWRASMAALPAADPAVKVRWAAAPLRPITLATTRLAEHWAHALDITGPLSIPYEDTDRLRHIAWLGHSTLPYAFALHNEPVASIRAELALPSGSVLELGPADAQATVRGPVGEFCRIGAQRMVAADSSLIVSNEDANRALRVLRNYAA